MKSAAPAAQYADRLIRRIVWDLPGLYSGALEIRYERTVTPERASVSVREGNAGAGEPPWMRGDFSAVLAELSAPHRPQRDPAPTLPAGAVRRREGGVELKLTGLCSHRFERLTAPEALLERHQLLEWRWWTGPAGHAPGGAPKFMPGGEGRPVGDAPLLLSAPLAALLLRRIAIAAPGAAARLAPFQLHQPFDDDGRPPDERGVGAVRTPELPWPVRAAAAVGWAGAGGQPDALPVGLLAQSFLLLDLDERHYEWALPLVALRDGEPRGWAGLFTGAGPLEELLAAIQAAGGRRAGYGLRPRGESAALILRPLSKLPGKLHAWKPESGTETARIDSALAQARELVRALR